MTDNEKGFDLSKRILEAEFKAEAAHVAVERLKGGNPKSYTPGEPWRNNVMYLTRDIVTDGNGKRRKALRDNINRHPANSPEDWELDETPLDFSPWSNDPVGFQYYDGIDGIHPQSLRKNNSKNWKCITPHVKTASNGPSATNPQWKEVLN